MTRGKGLARSQSLPRVPMKRTRSDKVRDAQAALDAVTPALEARSGGRCEVGIPGECKGKATNRHHRRRRNINADGKADTLGNLLHLCGSGTTGCHGWITAHPRDARRFGWIILTTDDPDLVPWASWTDSDR